MNLDCHTGGGKVLKFCSKERNEDIEKLLSPGYSLDRIPWFD